MQLRKVCNHPNLFEVRPIISPFQMEGIVYHTASLVSKALEYDTYKVMFVKLIRVIGLLEGIAILIFVCSMLISVF